MAKSAGASRRGLQIFMGILALAPLLSGIVGLKGIFNPLFVHDIPADLILDSNLRFLNGLSIGIGLAVYAVIPVIEKEQFALRIISVAIFIGGLARLLSIYDLGFPGFPLIIVIATELLSPLILIYWQRRIAL